MNVSSTNTNPKPNLNLKGSFTPGMRSAAVPWQRNASGQCKRTFTLYHVRSPQKRPTT